MFTKLIDFDMDTTLQKILQKVGSVQLGLLRCGTDDQKRLMQARAGLDEQLLNCIVESADCSGSLLFRNVNLIQRDKNDYLYITCRVKDEVVHNTATIISMEVLKACWFIRKSKGAVTWLKEKYTYEACPEQIDLAS